ncbi:hypothetical protein F7725_025118 [Dissostichus mawsoni]|uniref:Uncharacterized protein n=1 Tax=Dissostichus mawsoni TaxID=36200 RepID=A0A7J5XA80_DISMA|nr:hypothetical protein F7725_025118 [Dissostichus mawsoni]
MQTSLGGETLSTASAGAEQGSPGNKGDTNSAARNGDSACRQTDVDRQAPGALPSHRWRDPDFTAGSAAPVGCQLSTEQQAPPRPGSSAPPPLRRGLFVCLGGGEKGREQFVTQLH